MEHIERYKVEYDDADRIAWLRVRYGDLWHDHVDPADVRTFRDFDDLRAARRFATRVHGSIYERTNIRDITPPGDPPGLFLDWSETLLTDEYAWRPTRGAAEPVARAQSPVPRAARGRGRPAAHPACAGP